MGRRSQSTGYRGFSTREPVTAWAAGRQDRSPSFWWIGATVQPPGKSLISLGLSDPSERLILEGLAFLIGWGRVCPFLRRGLPVAFGETPGAETAVIVIQGKRLATGYEVV